MGFYIIKRKYDSSVRYSPPIDGSQIIPASILPQAVPEIIIIGEKLKIQNSSGTTMMTLRWAEAPGSQALIQGYNSAPVHVRSGHDLFLSSLDGEGIKIHAGNQSPTAPTGENLDLISDDDINITPGAAYLSKITRMSSTEIAIGGTINTNYQNTSGKLLFVTVTVRCDDGESSEFLMDSTTPPTTARASVTSVGSRTDAPMSMIIPINWYFKVGATVGAPTIVIWEEWTIG